MKRNLRPRSELFPRAPVAPGPGHIVVTEPAKPVDMRGNFNCIHNYILYDKLHDDLIVYRLLWSGQSRFQPHRWRSGGRSPRVPLVNLHFIIQIRR
jgi:hypothetical protein